MEIQGKTVLVTGASSGIGSAIAKAMVQAGAALVLLIARRENDLKKVAAEIGASDGNARIYPVDLSNPDQVTVIAQRIQGEAGVPDIIINNAGSGEWKFLEDWRYGLYRSAMGDARLDGSAARRPLRQPHRCNAIRKRTGRVAVLGAQSRQPGTDTKDRQNDPGA
jgi:NAD(P)-dependent dehydrogenase (short-subunit alcohol dehydrogenase family)